MAVAPTPRPDWRPTPEDVLNTRDFLIQFCRDEDSNISVAGAERIVDHLMRKGWLSYQAYLALGVDPDVADADPA